MKFAYSGGSLYLRLLIRCNTPVLCRQLMNGLSEACEAGPADVQEGVHLSLHCKALMHLVHKLCLAGLQAMCCDYESTALYLQYLVRPLWMLQPASGKLLFKVCPEYQGKAPLML